MNYDRQTFLTEFSVCFGTEGLADEEQQDNLIQEILSEHERRKAFMRELDAFALAYNSQIGRATREILGVPVENDEEARAFLERVRQCLVSIFPA